MRQVGWQRQMHFRRMDLEADATSSDDETSNSATVVITVGSERKWR
jgi:hypothetical protein